LYFYIHIVVGFSATRQAAFVERFTNTSCGPCLPAGIMMEGLTHDYGPETAVLQVHVNWPSPSDPFYLYCTADNQARWDHYGVTGVPTLCVDGKKLPSWSSTGFEVASRLGATAPLTIDTTLHERAVTARSVGDS